MGHTVFPHPKLTPQEMQGTALYREIIEEGPRKGTVIPGLMLRIYPFTLIFSNIPGEQNVLSINYVTSGLPSLMFAMTFSADIEFWKIKCQTLSGELLFDTTPVTVLLNLGPLFGQAAVSDATGSANAQLLRPTFWPLIWDPPWMVDGSQALQVSGTPINTTDYPDGTDQVPGRGVLNFAFWVWEIPGVQGTRGPAPPTPQFPPRPVVPSRRR